METKENIAKKKVENIMNDINDLIVAVSHARFHDKEPSNYQLNHVKESIALFSREKKSSF